MDKYEDVYKTSGAFSWTELMTSDAGKATEFYGKLFGWTFDTMDMGSGPYHVIKADGTAIGGLMKSPPEAAGAPPMWSCYVTVPNVDETARQCQAMGGKLLVGPMDIPTVGRFAVMQDPQGAVFNAISYTPK